MPVKTEAGRFSILILEDAEQDASILARALQALDEALGGPVEIARADSELALARLLSQRRWDAVVCDDQMPSMTWQRALQRVRKHEPDVPFIIVSEKRGQAYAVETMRAGCIDFIAKDRLTLLAPSIEREIAAARAAKRASERAQQTEETLRRDRHMASLGRIMTGIANPLLTQLTVVGGGLDLARDDVPRSTTDRDYLDDAQLACAQIEEMLGQLAYLSSSSRFEPTAIDARVVVRDVVETVEPALPSHISIAPSFPEHAVACLIDQGLIEHALIHLLLNARDAMPDGGTIELSLAFDRPSESPESSAAKPSLRFTVTDGGPGFSSSSRERAFEPFYTTRGPGSRGMGLPIVQNAAGLHAGTVQVANVRHSGCSIELRIPFRAATPTFNDGRDAHRIAGQPTVLLVEQDEAVTLLTRRLLWRAGCDVTAVRSVIDAKRAIEGHDGPYNFILSDSVLEDGTARDLLMWTRAQQLATPFLLISSYLVEAGESERIREGFDALLPKPYRIPDLVKALQRAESRR